MSKYSAKSSDRILPDEDNYPARLIRIIELGTQESPNSKFGDKFKVQLAFELVGTVVDEDADEPYPFVVYKSYNRSLGKKSILAQDIKSWTGKTFDNGEEFEMDDLLGKEALVQVIHSEDGQYANIAAITSVPKGTKVQKAHNELKSLYLDDNYDADVYESLPDGLKDKIALSPEWQEINEASKPKRKEKPGRDPLPAKKGANVKKNRR